MPLDSLFILCTVMATALYFLAVKPMLKSSSKAGEDHAD